ncbi:hypothetical protein [Rhodococcus sp. B10]|uniref:hypothetical protein n=1 Tax=Rhodococcus sp. B10 TaxID=2695876 RepID=UPI001430BF00|nr:hypothetical protein [Rhodococcus sp. B10]NIL77156.1 hypothetical protein [Rhodococcus sp. B10]
MKVAALVRTNHESLTEDIQRALIEDRVSRVHIKTKHGWVKEIQTWVTTSDIKTALRGLGQFDVVLVHSLDVADTDSFGGATTLLRPIDAGASLVDCRSKKVYTSELEDVMMLTMVCLSMEITSARTREATSEIPSPFAPMTDERERP